MTNQQQRPDTERILAGLKDFQRQTVDYVHRRLYEDPQPTNRFLIADEVGLGKTLAARGIIAKAIDTLWDEVERIDIVYICSNGDIARQNINRLKVTDGQGHAFATRMTLLPVQLRDLKQQKVNFVSFTPGTSFNMGSRGGVARERALIYHVLREGWGLGNSAGPINLLQCDMGKESWRSYLQGFNDAIDSDLSNRYLESLEARPDLKNRFTELAGFFTRRVVRSGSAEWDQARKLIGELRRILAESCVTALEPDLVILDEFQRFKDLMDGGDDVAQMAKVLFNYPGVKTLLLSATPYKMYTMYHEAETDDHYQDFIRTMRFLLNSDEETVAFEQELLRYRQELYRLGSEQPEGGESSRSTIEATLRRVMVRTERLSMTSARDGMLVESHDDLGRLETSDLRSYALIDRVARALDTGDTVEYWKSAPYILNLMDHGYKLKQKLVASAGSADRAALISPLLANGADSLLSWPDLQRYMRQDPGNAKLRTLLQQKVDSGAWKLLWLAPSLPYYRVNHGPYAEPQLQSFTKALVFSSWQVAPKAVAMFASYEAERLAVTGFEPNAHYDDERRRQRRLLQYRYVDGRPAAMAILTLFYPCLTLAHEVDPLLMGVGLASERSIPDVTEVTKVASQRVSELLQPILRDVEVSRGPVDERWYWAALALLDRRYVSDDVSPWLTTEDEDLAWSRMDNPDGDEEQETRFRDYVQLFTDCFLNGSSLGRPPVDLVDVVTKVALASPAVTALRSLLRVFPSHNDNELIDYLAAAAQMAQGFRSLFNQPESQAVARSLVSGEETRYWETVLDYCIGGHLQATLDEYVHVLRESLGLVNEPVEQALGQVADEVVTAVSIRSVNLDFDEIKPDPDAQSFSLERHRVRCRYAMRFGDGRDDDSGQETRADQVRRAFNSPFRPFVLASTSVGQEGLDFHQYCHDIYHWNLPSNPVDLEQREGRIHRYKGHVIRRNVAKGFPLAQLAVGIEESKDPWAVLFERAKTSRAEHCNDLVPYWVYEVEDGYKVQRHVPALPMSRELTQMEALRKTLVAYRMVFGQPRQEDLVEYLRGKLDRDLTEEELLAGKIDLSPNFQESHDYGEGS